MLTNNQFQKVLINFKSLVRHDQMEGKPYLVVPMIMLTEGVHSGTCGPLYYPKEEIEKIPQVWNAKPVIVYHPAAGESACSPEILTKRRIGSIMNTTVKEGLASDGKTKVAQLHAEAWLEEDRIKIVDERIGEAIENERMMELSTGLFTDNEKAEGKWNGEEYKLIARNYRPDHLAILPDLVGACSMADGAGFLRMNAEEQKNRISKPFADDCFEFLEAAGIDTAQLVPNAMSHGQVRDQLYAILRAKYKDEAWIEAVYDKFFIYSKGESLFKQTYTNKKEVVKVTGIPLQVYRKVQYVDATGKMIVGNEVKKPSNSRKELMMEKKELVDKIIGLEANQFSEKDREVLEATDEATLNKMIPVANEEKPTDDKTTDEKPTDEKPTDEKPTDEKPTDEKPTDEKPTTENKQTVDEYIDSAPDDVGEVLRSSVGAYRGAKSKVIEALVANSKCSFTKEQLETKDLVELRSLITLAGGDKVQKRPIVNFEGQADVLENVDVTSEKPLVAPVMNFGNKDEKS